MRVIPETAQYEAGQDGRDRQCDQGMGASSGADGSAATMRSTMDEARMPPLMAAVELSGPGHGEGN